jgi:hypothetical protein
MESSKECITEHAALAGFFLFLTFDTLLYDLNEKTSKSVMIKQLNCFSADTVKQYFEA